MDLFNQEETAVVPIKVKTKQSKCATQFHNLIKKIEKAQQNLSEKEENLDIILGYYVSEIQPVLTLLSSARTDLVPVLHEVLQRGALKPDDSFVLEKIILETIEKVTMHSEATEELKKIYAQIHGRKFADDMEESFKEQVEDLQDFFKSQGINLDLSDLNSGMSEVELMTEIGKKIASKYPEMEAKEKPRKQRKKSDKALDAEQNRVKMVELRNRSITSIYRELAKMLHPDLEMDVAIKQEKEELMKNLTVAYEKQDLYTLIKLELQWLNKREGRLEQMGDDVMKAFNDQLKIQLKQLEFEIGQMDFAPKYYVLIKLTDGMPILITRWSQLQKDFVEMELSIRRDIVDITTSKSPVPKTIREVIKLKKQMMKEEESEMNDFENYFGDFL